MHTATGRLILIRQPYVQMHACTIATWIYWHNLHVLKCGHLYAISMDWPNPMRSPVSGCHQESVLSATRARTAFHGWMINHVNCTGIHGNMLEKFALETLTPSDTPAKLQTRRQPQIHVGGCRCKSSAGKRCSGTCSMEEDAMKY